LRDTEKETFILINKLSDKPTHLNELINENNILENYKCELCHYTNPNLIQNTELDFSSNSCVVLKFNIIKNLRELTTILIKDFDENYIVIPGDKKNNVFIVKAAIVFKPFFEKNAIIGGHYVCWRRGLSGEGWLEISDTTSIHHKTFLASLKGIYLMFLEKKHLMF